MSGFLYGSSVFSEKFLSKVGTPPRMLGKIRKSMKDFCFCGGKDRILSIGNMWHREISHNAAQHRTKTAQTPPNAAQYRSNAPYSFSFASAAVFLMIDRITLMTAPMISSPAAIAPAIRSV